MKQSDWLNLGALLNRYWEVTRQAWSSRRASATPAKISYEVEFLPAHLEIVEKPVHPAPLWTMRVIGLLVLAALLVALLGHLDIIAVARGKLVPNARVKVIQPAVTGVVRGIWAHNGAHVAAGELLLELDPAQAAADTDKARAAKLDAELAMARARSLLEAQSTGRPPALQAVTSAPQQRQAQAYAEGLYSEYRNKVASLQAHLAQREAERETVQDEIQKLKGIAPLARQQAKDYESLVGDKYVPKHAYLDKEQNALQQEGDLRIQSDRAVELSAAIEGQKQEIATTVATFRREQLADLERAQQSLTQATDDEAKAVVRERLLKLTAPIGGTVQNLSVHTLGEVVTTAQPLLEIVPDDALEVEASIDNKDIGFVQEGQEAVIKIEAFPYTRFGYLRGRVTSVANDAVEDRKSGLRYLVRVALPADHLVVRDRRLALTAGMQVTAEIRTGRRSVAEYFTSPLVETVGQSMIER